MAKIDPNDRNFREDYVPDALPPPFRGISGQDELTEGYFGASLGLVADVIAHVMTLASMRMHCLLDTAAPADELPLHGSERRMPRYPAETDAQYTQRLHGAWDVYRFAGGRQAIIDQLAAAGYADAEIVVNAEWVSPYPYDEDNWSRFWVILPVTGHSFTSGPIPADDEVTIRSIVKKWKPPHWVCVTVSVQLTADARLVGWPMDGATFADLETAGYTFDDLDDWYKFEVS